MVELLFFGISAVYALQYIVFWLGLRRVFATERQIPKVWPTISVLVAARNEEQTIAACMDALAAQDYPRDQMQVIIVNDESEDRTLEIANGIAAEHPALFTIISTHPEQSHARAKARAIAQGMDNATGEIILLTDSDCIPGAGWARGVVEHFVPGVDVYAGFTIVRSHNLFTALQQLDWINLLIIASASNSYNSPIGVAGNNMAFRRNAYHIVGGYRKVPFTVTEDFALFLAMYREGMRVTYPCTEDTRMPTLPCNTLMQVMRQKQRWGRGGMESSLHGYSILVIAVLMLTTFSIAPFVSLWCWGVVWVVKFACDLLLLFPTLRQLGELKSIRYIPFFEFYFIVQVFIMPFLLMKRKVVWKGREFRS